MPRKEEPKAKLGWVLGGEFTYDPHRGPNRLAADALIASLSDVLLAADQVLASTVAMLGEAVDADPTNAALWGQYRAAVDQIRAVRPADDDDEFTKFLANLGGSEVRNAPQSE